MNRWVQDIDMTGVIVIQKRVAYFDCTVVLGDNSVALSLAELPSFSSPASLVRPRLRHAMVGDVDWHRNFVGSRLVKMPAHRYRRSRLRSGVEVDRRPCEDLIRRE